MVKKKRPVIEFDEEKHKYYVDGVEKPSVTTILGYVTADHYGQINEAVLRQAAQRGSDVHEACQMIDYGCEAEVDPVTAPYVEAYLQFLNDYRPKWDEIEQKHYSERGFCGTVDRMGTLNYKPCVLDIKTTGSPTKMQYLVYAAQLVAYSMFYEDGADFKRYILFLKKDGKYRLVDADEYAEKHGMMPFFVWHKCLDLYQTIAESLGKILPTA